MSIFAERLKECRVKKGLTQEQLANVFGISKNSVFCYETDRREPGIDTLTQFAQYFEVTADYLLGLSDNRTVETAAIGDLLGLNDEAIHFLSEYKEILDRNIPNTPYHRATLLECINRLICEPTLLQRISSYLYQELNPFVDYGGTNFAEPDEEPEENTTVETVASGQIVIMGEMDEVENNPYVDTTYMDMYEASQAMNMYQIQTKLMELARKIEQEAANAQKDKRQE